MKFDIFKGNDHSVAFDDETERYSLFVNGNLLVSSMSSTDISQRAADKGVTLTPASFVAGMSYDNKPINVTPKQGKWEMTSGSTPVEFNTISACIQAALARHQPPKKAALLK
jgi:hypothetical protein